MLEPTKQSVDYFSSTVSKADENFKKTCTFSGVTPIFYTHPESGPNGEELNVGVCRIGPTRSTKCFLIISGTHGIEGYGGAGIQIGLLERYSDFKLPDDTSIVLVHLINPWGTAWNRRENENNMDVFRNFLYHDDPIEPDPLFDIIDDTYDWPNWEKTSPEKKKEKEEKLIKKYGLERLIAAVRQGQHHRSKAMTYHGNKASWSKITLDTIIVRFLNGSRKIAVMDIHTGFGKYGEGIVMSYEPIDSSKYQRVLGWMKGDLYTPGVDADIPSHSKNPYSFVEDLIPHSECVAQILEFGTYDPAMSRDIFPDNHYIHNYGDPLSDWGCEVAEKYRKFLYPEEDDWKTGVWKYGKQIIQMTLEGIDRWNE